MQALGTAYKHDNIPVRQTSIYLTTNSVTTESIFTYTVSEYIKVSYIYFIMYALKMTFIPQH